jgi:hypothetical protein
MGRQTTASGQQPAASSQQPGCSYLVKVDIILESKVARRCAYEEKKHGKCTPQ